MRPRPVALICVLALSAGLGACGSDSEISGAIPRTTPDLTIPTKTSDAPASRTDTTSTTSTTTTSTTPAGGSAPSSGSAAPPAAATPPAAAATPQGSSTTGGAAPTGQSTTGGATANGGEFKSFCSQNPGAC